MEVRCRDEGLDVTGYEPYQRIPSLFVELTHHIVEQKDRFLIEHIPDQRHFRKFETQHDGTLLSLASVYAGVLSLNEEFDSIGMGAYYGMAASALLFPAVLQRNAHRIERILFAEDERLRLFRIVLFPRGNIRRLNRFTPIGDFPVIPFYLSQQLHKQRASIAVQLRADREQRFVDRIEIRR